MPTSNCCATTASRPGAGQLDERSASLVPKTPLSEPRVQQVVEARASASSPARRRFSSARPLSILRNGTTCLTFQR